MKLRSLSLKGFRSFADEATLNFPESGLVLLRGKNIDSTGVSSGSGKSSILLAIAYALKYCPYDASQLQSWIGKEKLEVRLELDGASLVRGTRSSIKVGEQEITGVAAVDKKLFDHIGLNPSLLEALTYRPQQSRGLFLSKTNSEMQEFLSMLLGLEKFEEAIEGSNVKYKELETDLQKAQGVRFVCEEGLKRSTLPLEVLKDPQVHEDVIADTKKETAKLAELVQTQNTSYENERKKLETIIAGYRTKKLALNPRPAPEFDSSEIKKKESLLTEATRRFKLAMAEEAKERNKLDKAKAVYASDLALLYRERNTLPILRSELEKLQNSRCPTCDQAYAIEKRALATRAIEIKTIEQASGQIQELERLLNAPFVFPQDEIQRWESVLANLSQEIAVLKSQKDKHASEHATKEVGRVAEARALLLEEEREATSKLQMIVDARRNALEEAKSALTTNQHQLEIYQRQLTEAQEFNVRTKQRNDAFLAEMEQVRKELNVAEENVAKIQKDRNAELDLVTLLKGFMTAIFDEVLNEISWNANQMLSKIPNVSHVSMGFKSESVTLKGTIKRAITPYLNIGGSERPLKAALSGGMLAAVELAVDLAVRKVISARTGVTPGWLILDESFEGLGPTEKEAVMELLKQVSNDTLILIVDHSTEFKEFFTQIVEVEFQGGRSKIVGKQ